MKEHKNDIRKLYIAYNTWTRDDEHSMLVWLGLAPLEWRHSVGLLF